MNNVLEIVLNVNQQAILIVKLVNKTFIFIIKLACLHAQTKHILKHQMLNGFVVIVMALVLLVMVRVIHHV